MVFIAANLVISDYVSLPIPPSQIKQEKTRDHQPTTESVAASTVVISPELKTSLAAFVRDRMEARSVICVSELRLQLSLHLAGLPPGHVLGVGVSDRLLEQALVDTGMVRLRCVNLSGETLYVLPERGGGNSLDLVRRAVVELLGIKPVIKITTLRKKLSDELTATGGSGQVPTDVEMKKVLKEYCLTRGGSWHLKGTIDA